MSTKPPPASPTIDVLGLGNAIVDVIAQADDRHLERVGLDKGTMTLVDEHRMVDLYAHMGQAIEMSGGSCANTMAALASLGGRAAYVGKVQKDQLGDVFAHDLRAIGVDFRTAALVGGPATARCLVSVTPDAQRTMATYLGACVELGPDDVVEDQVAAAALVYMEGYLWDRPNAKAAFLRAADLAHGHGRLVALTLSDPFCVERWRAEFLDLIGTHVDVVIANEVEATSLFQTDQLDDAVERLAARCQVAAITLGADGSLVVAGTARHRVGAAPVEHVVDTTGAGDLYAAGLLYGLARGLPLPACGRLGSLAAAEVLGHYGARPQAPLAPLVAAAIAG